MRMRASFPILFHPVMQLDKIVVQKSILSAIFQMKSYLSSNVKVFKMSIDYSLLTACQKNNM